MRLILLRHAKSAWNTDAPSDHARPLNKRGRRDAPRIGAALKARGWVPKTVLSSDAVRTRETWTRMAPELTKKARVRFMSALYHADARTIENIAAQHSRGTVMIIAHNPGLEDLVAQMSGQSHPFTTCNAALFKQTDDDGWELVEIIRPKELP